MLNPMRHKNEGTCLGGEAMTRVVVVVLTLTHRYNAVRGHRARSNNSGAADYLRRKTNKKQKIITQ